MAVEIDQSGKIEDTAKPTVIAFSNGESGTIFLPGKESNAIFSLYELFATGNGT